MTEIRHLRLLLSLWLLLTAAGCATDPVTGDRRFSVVDWTTEEEVKLYDTLTPGDGNWKAFFYLGILELRAGKGPSAVKRLEKARSYFPVQPAVHFFLASAYEMAGDAVRARDSYQEVLQLTSRRSDLYREARRRLQRL